MSLKIRYRPSVVSRVAGERCVGPEWQLVGGRKIIGRFDLESQAKHEKEIVEERRRCAERRAA